MSSGGKNEKRERRLILDGSPCDTNFYPEGPRTVAESRKQGRSMCPHFEKCDNGGLNTNTSYGCIMKYGLDVAGFVLKQGNTVSEEVRGEFKDFFGGCNPPKGFVYSHDRKTFVFITDKKEALKKIEEFATSVVGGKSTERPTQAVGSTFGDVVSHAMTSDGAIDLSRMEELEGRFGSNGGRGCDVGPGGGPCSCGAWH